MRPVLTFLSLAFLFLFSLTGCSKKNDGPSYATAVNFTYNGQQYQRSSGIMSDLIIVQNEILLVNFTGLHISDQNNLLGGDLFILAKNSAPCAYLQPTGLSVGATGGNCGNLSSGGNPIDSVRVYWYESGNISFTYTDCKAITNAIVPGQKDCAITGNFDITLVNKNGQRIRLTNGSFSGRLRKYP